MPDLKQKHLSGTDHVNLLPDEHLYFKVPHFGFKSVKFTFEEANSVENLNSIEQLMFYVLQ